MYEASLILFRRDLRLHDNTALNAALRQSRAVLPCFILDRRLLSQLGSDWLRVRYLLAALQDLDTALRERGTRLHVVYAQPQDGLLQLLQASGAQAVFCHDDAGPYAVRRDVVLRSTCEASGVAFHAVDDVTLHPPAQTLKADGTPYTVFTPFFRRAAQLPVHKPQRLANGEWFSLDGAALDLAQHLRAAQLQTPADISPAAEARTALQALGRLQQYDEQRDLPAVDGTSRLSALLRFGIVSVREAWWAIAQSLGNEHPLLRQLYWRDFFFSIALHFPRVFSGCFHVQYNRLRWPDNGDLLQAWRDGRTGFPIVDAGLRELRATGYMHNRVRMIVASFLVKDLHCDWRHGERHFAEQLVDYDPAINNGNWQWAASTGCDAQPYFRIFNPWTQQQKFDPDCAYVKRWLPELQNTPSKTLHHLFKLDEALPGYVRPVVDHATQAARAKQLFESVRALK